MGGEGGGVLLSSGGGKYRKINKRGGGYLAPKSKEAVCTFKKLKTSFNVRITQEFSVDYLLTRQGTLHS